VIERGRAVSNGVAEWDEVLCAYAAVLDEQRALLTTVGPEGFAEGHDLTPLAFVPPTGLPPFPAELEGRAAALLRESAGLAALAQELLVQYRPASTSRAAGSATPGTAWLDRQL
jgi:hypothetical protein